MFAFMQDSVRPYVDPEDCIGSIKTYEDTNIDVLVQMDVDEFYNLLFDRWEKQFITAIDRKKFRSIYGGTLVQQIRSQECEHVSEKQDAFSAIQCDIKGKNTLQESLEAYVEGEIMEGGKCYWLLELVAGLDAYRLQTTSTSARHVTAMSMLSNGTYKRCYICSPVSN
jgi:ubiquitin carboxyl-terminal hydrolase 34